MATSLPFSAGGSSAQMTILIRLTLWLIPLALACLLGLSVYSDISALSAPSQSAPTQNINTSKNGPTMNASLLASFNLLGKLGEAPAPAKINRDLPQTRLQFELKGAFTNTDTDEASALIAGSKGKPSKRYRVGDTLPGGAKLHSVSADSVTLDRGGNLEVLSFPKAKSISSGRTSSRNSQSRSRTTLRGNENRDESSKKAINARSQNSRLR